MCDEPTVIQASSLRVVLQPGFALPMENYLRKLGGFRREEGGYLIGRFERNTIYVEESYWDSAADSSPGDIRLSTSSFDSALKQSLVTRSTIVGTWHLHPDGFGARYSQTDFETLFIDRMVLNASDPSGYTHPWVHAIIPGVNLSGIRVYALKPQSIIPVRVDNTAELLNTLCVPPQHSYGFILLDRRQKGRYVPAQRRLLAPALRSGRFHGIWRRVEQPLFCEPSDTVLVENICRQMLRVRDPSTPLPTSVHYKQLCVDELGRLLAYAYSFTVPDVIRPEVYVPLTPELGEQTRISLCNPNLDEGVYEVSVPSAATVSTLSQLLRSTKTLTHAPVFWTIVNPQAARRFASRTRVDEYGKVFLSEDLFLRDIVADRITRDTPIYWESAEDSPELVYALRTDRLTRVGYRIDLLRNRMAVIAGVGLLGCQIAHLLGVVGIGNLRLIDKGLVDWSDVYRQMLFRPVDVGKAKAAVAAGVMSAMGSRVAHMELEIPSVLIDGVDKARDVLHRLCDVVRGADIVVGALDSFSSRAVLQIVCRMCGVPFLAASLDHLPSLNLTQGTITLFGGRTGQCYGCGSLLKIQKDSGGCTMAPLEFPGIIGSLTSKIVYDALTSEDPIPTSCRVYADYRVEVQPLGNADATCEVCALAEAAKSAEHDEWTEPIIRWLIS